MILSVICMLLSIACATFITIINLAIQVAGQIPTLFMICSYLVVWLCGVGFVLSVIWFNNSLDDYRYEQDLLKDFEEENEGV